jgi:hypothetical protein
MHKHHFFKFFRPVQIRKQRGAALAETLMALLPILLLASLCIELARGYQVRHLLILSLQQAARVAAVHHAAPQAWQPVLREALATLFAPDGQYASPQARRDATCEAFKQAFRMPCWHAVALPSPPETIHLRLTYLHSPIQDWLRVLLQKIVGLSTAFEQTAGLQCPLEREAWRLGLIPMVVEYRVIRHRSTY